jgi:hypothetical protein
MQFAGCRTPVKWYRIVNRERAPLCGTLPSRRDVSFLSYVQRTIRIGRPWRTMMLKRHRNSTLMRARIHADRARLGLNETLRCPENGRCSISLVGFNER